VLGRWVSAEAATDFTAAGVFGLLKSFDAFEATRADVCSLEGFLVAIAGYLSGFGAMQ
jgi:hypothetical protein